MEIKRYSEEELKNLQDKTDNDRIKKMTEDEIEKNAESDPDSLTPTDEELKNFRKVKK